MSNISYSKATIFNRPYADKTGCYNCKHHFEVKELFVVKETKVNWFRGDDIVEFLCVNCANNKALKALKLKRKAS